MSKQIDALKLANEALDEMHYSSGTVKAVTLYKSALAAIREALAGDNMSPTEQTEQEQVGSLEITYGRDPEIWVTPNAEDLPEGTYRLYAAPAQPMKQEPVAWVTAKESFCGFPKLVFSETQKDGYKPLYAAPVDAKAIQIDVDTDRIIKNDPLYLQGRAEALEEAAKVKKLYEELLYSVEQKFPDETRHQTALRYIRQAERGNGEQAQYAAAIRGLK